jgi:hypothetical protein
MGWYFTEGTSKQDIIKELIADGRNSSGSEWRTIRHALKGNTLWSVIEATPPADLELPIQRYIACFLLASRHGGWGYKDMDESMGPNEVSCPLTFLHLVPDPGGYATAWRKRVREYHRETELRKIKLESLALGQVVALVTGCRPPEISVASLKPLQGYGPNGRLYRVNPKHIDISTDR